MSDLTLEPWFSHFQVVYCTDFCQQPRNKSQWVVVSPLRPRGRAAEMVPRGALALDESRADPVHSGWAGAPQRGRGNGGKRVEKGKSLFMLQHILIHPYLLDAIISKDREREWSPLAGLCKYHISLPTLSCSNFDSSFIFM